MKKAKKVLLVSIGVLLAMTVLGQILIWKDDMEARENRQQVYDLVQVGDDLKSEQKELKDAGFKLRYEEPITPTINNDYLEQLVIIGDTQPNFFETLKYTTEAPWMPFVHGESPYVIINATLEGEITRLK